MGGCSHLGASGATGRFFWRWALLLWLCFTPLALFAATPSPAVYAQLNFDKLSLSPDGTKYAGIVVSEGKSFINIATLPSNDVIISSPFKKGSIYDLTWAGPEYLIATLWSGIPKQDGVKMVVRTVWKLDLKNRRWSQILANSPHYSSFVRRHPATRILDGRPHAFLTGYKPTGNLGNPVLALLNVDLETRQVRLEEEGNLDTIAWIIDSKGRATARADFDSAKGRTEIYGRAPGSSNWRLIDTVYSGLDVPNLIGNGASDNEVIYTKLINDVSVTHLHDLPSGAVTILATSASDRLLIDPANSRWFGRYKSKPEGSETSFLDPADQKLWQNVVKAWPGEIVQFWAWSEDRNVILVNVSGRRSGIGVFIVDRKAKTAQRIIDDVPGVTAADYAEQRVVQLQIGDGGTTPAHLTLPPGRPEKALPLVVFYPESEIEAGFEWQAQALASRGYAVLQPQKRADRNAGARIDPEIADLKAGIETLTRSGIVDPARVCIIGQGSDGSSAVLAVAVDKTRYRCVASISAIYDWRALFEVYRKLLGPGGDSLDYRRLRRRLGVTGHADPRLPKLSPINHVAAIEAPILIMNKNQAHEQADAMVLALRRNGKQVEQVTCACDGWDLETPDRVQLIESLVGFFEKHNPPGAKVATTPVAQVIQTTKTDLHGN